jgi:hypothetical protein
MMNRTFAQEHQPYNRPEPGEAFAIIKDHYGMERK